MEVDESERIGTDVEALRILIELFELDHVGV